MPKEEEKFLNISWDFCLKVVVIVVFLYFIYLIKNLLVWLIFALILSILFNFIIDALEKKKVPRPLASFLVYFGTVALVGFIFYAIAPLFLAEIEQFNTNFSVYFQKVFPFLKKLGIKLIQKPDSFLQFLSNNLELAGENIFKSISVIFGGAQAAISIIFLAFFISLEKDFLERFLSNFAPRRYRSYLFTLLPRIKKKVNGWFVSRLVGIAFVTLLSFAAFLVFEIRYAFILSLIFGLLDFIPFLGPLLGAVIVFAVVAVSSITQAFFALLAMIIIQQLENNFLIPLLFRRVIGVPPVLILIALLVGAELWGFLGSILAVPLAGVIFELAKDYLKWKRREKERSEREELGL